MSGILVLSKQKFPLMGVSPPNPYLLFCLIKRVGRKIIENRRPPTCHGPTQYHPIFSNHTLNNLIFRPICFMAFYDGLTAGGSPRMVRNIGFVALVSFGRWGYKTNIFHSRLPFLWLLSFG